MSCVKFGLLHSRLRSQQRFRMSVNVCPDEIFWTAEHFAIKLGVVMQHHAPECHAEKKIVRYFQGGGHSEGSYDQNMTLSTLSSELLIPWQPNFFLKWYVIISQSVLGKKLDYCIQGQGHSEGSKFWCLSRWYFRSHQTFRYQIWCSDASSWAGVSCKKTGLLFSRSRS